jgi:HSP20 family protein
MSLIRFKNSALPSLVGDFFTRESSDIFLPFQNQTIPSVNIIEEKDHFEIHLVAPGLKKDNFQINLEENVLTISYSKTEEKEDEKVKFTRREFKINSFKRSFTINQLIDSEQVSATYLDGILVINLPKKEEVKLKNERLIEIQ